MTHGFFFSLLSSHPSLGYLFVLIGMIFEGEATLFVIAFLTHDGYFNLILMALTVFLGTTLGSALWYWFGLKMHGTFLNRWSEKVARPFDNHLQRRTFHTIFISKFTYGVHHLLLFRAGILKIPFEKYMKENVVANVIWISIVGTVGYLGGASFGVIKHYLKYAEVTLLLVLVAFLAIWHLISDHFKKEL